LNPSFWRSPMLGRNMPAESLDKFAYALAALSILVLIEQLVHCAPLTAARKKAAVPAQGPAAFRLIHPS